MTKECYENLANAVVEQAVKDYVKTIQVLKRDKNSIDAQKMLKDVLSFFHSEWFTVLTDLDPDVLINKIHKEVL